MADINKTILQSLGSGLAGASVLTAIHETVRQFSDEAPRADILGMRAIKKILHKADAEVPADDELHNWALGGDILQLRVDAQRLPAQPKWYVDGV